MNDYRTLMFMILIIFIGSCKDNPTLIENNSESIIDIDGNEYKIIKIGNQWWMAENLKVTRYNNGDSIPNITKAEDWGNYSLVLYAVMKIKIILLMYMVDYIIGMRSKILKE